MKEKEEKRKEEKKKKSELTGCILAGAMDGPISL